MAIQGEGGLRTWPIAQKCCEPIHVRSFVEGDVERDAAAWRKQAASIIASEIEPRPIRRVDVISSLSGARVSPSNSTVTSTTVPTGHPKLRSDPHESLETLDNDTVKKVR